MRPFLLRYGLALVVSCVAVLPRLVTSAEGVGSSLLLLLAAVVVSSRYGGIGPGLLAALAGSLATLALSGNEIGSNTLHLFVGSQLGLFVLVALVISWMLRRTRQRIDSQDGLISAMTNDPDVGMLLFDRRGQVTLMNDAAEAMLGWTQSDLAGRDALAIIRPTIGAYPQAATGSILSRIPDSSRVPTGDDVFQRRDGSMLPVLCTFSPVVIDGQSTGRLLTFRDDTERRQAASALRDSEERYRHLIDTMPLGVLLTDLHGAIIMANPHAATSFGYNESSQLLGKLLSSLVMEKDARRLQEALHQARLGHPLRDMEYTARTRDSETYPIEMTFSWIRGRDAEPGSLLIVAKDLTDRRRAEQALLRSESRKTTQHAIAASLASSIMVSEAVCGLLEGLCKSDGWDVGVFWRVNQEGNALNCWAMWHAIPETAGAFEELTYRMTPGVGEDLPGHTWETGKAIWVEDIMSVPSFSRVLVASQAGLRSGICVPVLMHGQVYGVLELLSRTMRPLDADFVRMVSTIGAQLAQFLERKEAEKALEYQASHDTLTDLPNRSLLFRRLHRAIQAARDDSTPVALLLIDLDRFKEVNDTLGHHFGDLLLQQVARRLMSVLRDSDTVARLGGDEFAVLLPRTTIDGAMTVANTILSSLAQPMMLDGRKVDVWGSIGIGVFPEHAEHAELLVQRADVAMYVAKRARGGAAVYSPEQDEHSAGRLEIVAELRQAIEQGVLVLHYQPKVDFQTGRVNSVEALVRWPHPQRGLVPPDEFIPLAEQTGLIQPLTRWVLASALGQCRRWHADGINVRVGMNLSAHSLHEPGLVEMIREVLAGQECQASWLEIEITESAIMVDSARSLATLKQLDEMGVRIAIDDFGTGYSSLSYLKQLPVHEIKIDRSFVIDMNDNDSDRFIARSVIDLGHNLGLRVVAEGVQSKETWNILNTMQCDVGQGYHTGHPLPPLELTPWLLDSNTGEELPPAIEQAGA